MDGQGMAIRSIVPPCASILFRAGDCLPDFLGKGQLVTIAKSQLGNEGGQKFWSWYGFDSREEWCACFVSWCADQSGLIASGNVPKFSLCSDGVSWFQGKISGRVAEQLRQLE